MRSPPVNPQAYSISWRLCHTGGGDPRYPPSLRHIVATVSLGNLAEDIIVIRRKNYFPDMVQKCPYIGIEK
jgi:hypothetical protein